MAFLENDEDMLVVEATLNYLEEYAIDSVLTPTETSSLPLSSSATASSPLSHLNEFNSDTRQNVPRLKTSKPKKRQTNPNRARNELRFELVYLREKVAQLQSELRALQINPPTKAMCPASHESKVTSGDSAKKISVWAGVATRQRQRREDSERENVRLRLVVDRHRKVATELSDLLRKRVNQQVADCVQFNDPSIAHHRFVRVADFNGDIEDFRELFEHLDKAYQEVDAVFAANNLAATAPSSDDVRIHEGGDGKYLEFFADKVLPFPLCDTTEATWNYYKGTEKHFGNGGIYEKAAKNLDEPYTIIEDFTKEVHSYNSRADIRERQIVRRYVEADRDIVILVSSVSPIEIKHKKVAGITYHLRGYAITSRSLDSTPEHEMSLLQICTRVSLDTLPGTTHEPDHVRALYKFLLGNIVGNIRSHQKLIENSLVDHALKSRLQLSSA
ncbi:hypothetical protein PHYBOEH_000616 [Phytophthora boehmeriae]|uniref:M96 mating-specific protein family n=1 Tax=Phytophthora boehmeriae TaxID=109152 RepID=A0A8T1XB84_9STRA|nr:hypothetical protein PHYBOEH_000616 [Phytophthora boehmeriae]